MTNENYDIITSYWSLKDDPLFPFDEETVAQYPSKGDEIVQKRNEFTAVNSRLDKLTVADLKQCKRNLLKAIEIVMATVSANKLGYPLARNQGLVIPNYVYGKILSVIAGAAKAPLGVGYPDFYYERGGDFNAQPLLEILRDFKQDLQTSEFASYPMYVEFFEKYQNQIQALWKRENQERHGKTAY